MNDFQETVKKFGETVRTGFPIFGDSLTAKVKWTGRKPYWELKHIFFKNWMKEIDSKPTPDFIFIKLGAIMWFLGFRPLYRSPEIEDMVATMKARFPSLYK